MVITITPETCINLNQSIKTFCLPELIECQDQPKYGRFTDCDNIWNCNLPSCVYTGYRQPFKRGDKIQFQTIFFSGKPSAPTPYDDMIGLQLCSPDGTGDINDFICRKMSAWKDNKVYQILEIDTTDMPECFSIEYTEISTGNKCCIQEFGEKKDCKETVLIQSKRDTKDCFGYCYGVPDTYEGDLIEYNNSLRYCGWIKPTGCSREIERSETNRALKKEVISDISQLGFNTMPIWAKNILCDQLLTGSEICIDGIEYDIDSFDITNRYTNSFLWQFSVEVYRICDNSTNNCK